MKPAFVQASKEFSEALAEEHSALGNLLISLKDQQFKLPHIHDKIEAAEKSFTAVVLAKGRAQAAFEEDRK